MDGMISIAIMNQFNLLWSDTFVIEQFETQYSIVLPNICLLKLFKYKRTLKKFQATTGQIHFVRERTVASQERELEVKVSSQHFSSVMSMTASYGSGGAEG